MDIYDPIAEALNISSTKFVFDLNSFDRKLVPDFIPWNKGIGDYMTGSNNPMYGTKRPDSVKQAVSKANKGRKQPQVSKRNTQSKWWTNGVNDTFKEVCPPGYYAGRSKIKGSANPVNIRWSCNKKP